MEGAFSSYLTKELNLVLCDESVDKSSLLRAIDPPGNCHPAWSGQEHLIFQRLEGQWRVDAIVYVSSQSLVKSSWESRDQPTIIPQGVPYMVKLLRYYVSEDAVYLHLEHIKGESPKVNSSFFQLCWC